MATFTKKDIEMARKRNALKNKIEQKIERFENVGDKLVRLAKKNKKQQEKSIKEFKRIQSLIKKKK